MMNQEPIATVVCACGWPRPLIAVSLDDGSPPRDDYRVRYDCPRCGKAHAAGRIADAVARESARAKTLAADGAALEAAKHEACREALDRAFDALYRTCTESAAALWPELDAQTHHVRGANNAALAALTLLAAKCGCDVEGDKPGARAHFLMLARDAFRVLDGELPLPKSDAS